MTSTHPSDVRRRTVLALAGTSALGALAGCTSALSSDDDSGEETDETEETEADGPLTDYEYTAPPQIVDLAEQNHESTLRTVSARHQIVSDEAKGGPVELPEVWAWQADDLAPSVPGPIYRMQEGETFELTFENTHTHPHTVHVHAVGKSWKDDGAPVSTRTTVDPDDSKTYVLEGNVPGTHFYHCHVQTHNHLDMGMYGIIRVDPEGYESPDREYFLTLREWDDRLHEQQAGGDAEYDVGDRNPNLYTVNGRSAPTTFHPELGSPLIMSQGETVRVHVVNAGYDTHAFHTHGHRFTVVEEEGSPISEAAQYEEDVVPIAPAERLTLEFEADSNPGIYPVHCHKVDHVTTDGKYPGGMATAIVYEEAMETDEFAEVMADAGYEG